MTDRRSQNTESLVSGKGARMEPLVFNYSARLAGQKPACFIGLAQLPDWQTKHLPTKETAAWAFVRSLLKWPGAWLCSVVIGGEEDERTIDVEECEGALFRHDRKKS